MNCFEHEDRSSVTRCEECGVGICEECEKKTFFTFNKKPICKRCNHDRARENKYKYNQRFNAEVVSLIINSIGFITGIIVFIAIRSSNYHIILAVLGMLLCWGAGFILSIVIEKNIKKMSNDDDPVLSGLKESDGAFGKIILFIIAGIFSPYMIFNIIKTIIRINNDINENNKILSKLNAV